MNALNDVDSAVGADPKVRITVSYTENIRFVPDAAKRPSSIPTAPVFIPTEGEGSGSPKAATFEPAHRRVDRF
jgi:hypothetical protein